MIFCPLVVLSCIGVAILRKEGKWTGLWMAIVAILILQWLVISAHHYWWGGDSYGPRYFTDVIPFFSVLALPAVEFIATRRTIRPGLQWRHFRRLLLVFAISALAWSVFVEAQGSLLRSAWCWNAEPTKISVDHGKFWSWSDPQFLRGIRTLIWGPDRNLELVRDGVVTIGCPSEPVRP